jgi:uncharacterized protein
MITQSPAGELAARFPLSRDELRNFCRRWQVRELSIFGSVLRDDFRDDSDIDVLVSFAPAAPWSLWDLVSTRDELVKFLGREVDLVEEEGLPYWSRWFRKRHAPRPASPRDSCFAPTARLPHVEFLLPPPAASNLQTRQDVPTESPANAPA